jgi:hypothetical protein
MNSLDDFLSMTAEPAGPREAVALLEEIQVRLTEWRDRIDFYQDSDALNKQNVLDQINLLIQISDELFDSMERNLE